MVAAQENDGQTEKVLAGSNNVFSICKINLFPLTPHFDDKTEVKIESNNTNLTCFSCFGSLTNVFSWKFSKYIVTYQSYHKEMCKTKKGSDIENIYDE